jgi:diguanylate cyclase (GGDEF)-like protein/PAS domain S-box-containing protein
MEPQGESMHERATTNSSPARPDRTGRRPLVERRQLRSMLERSTGITPQALGHLPGLVVAVLDLDYVTLELSSTIPGQDEAWAQARTDQPFLDALPESERSHVRAQLDQVTANDTVSWRHVDEHGITYETEAAPIHDPFTAAVIGVVMISRDASDKAAAEHARDAVLRGFRASFERAPIPQAMLDADGSVHSANAAFSDLVGHEPEDLVGKPFGELILPRDTVTIDRAIQASQSATSGSSRQDADARLLHADGDSVHCAVHMIGFDDDALGARTIVQVLDQTERDRYEAELRMIANHDSLTGLLNRRGFRERVADSLSTGRRRNEARTLLLIDIDHFKTINDLHGHAVGDTMLCELAEAIQAVTDPRDPAARIAGDEFAVLCVGGPTSARASAAALLELIRDRAAGERRVGRPPMTVSIGLAEVDPVMDDVDDVLMRADMALYEAKGWGRDRIVEAASFVAGDAARRSDRILQSLRRALTSDGLVLHSQPILDLHRGRVSQHEMLARLAGEDGAMLSPGEFLPIAERHGLMPQLDAWVARQTIALLGAQVEQGRSLPTLHLNMSARSADHPELISALTRDIELAKIPAGHVVIELTETAKLTDLDMARHFADQLTGIGCQLALDDFGAGFNSLIHLRALPVQYVKIDGSITRDAAIDERAAVLVEGIASTARALGVRSVASYVDTQACLSRLGSLGVDYAQGFQVGVPAPLTSNGRPARAHVATEVSADQTAAEPLAASRAARG